MEDKMHGADEARLEARGLIERVAGEKHDVYRVKR